MTDSADGGDGQNGGSVLFKRACDHCRARKVKCDKTSPCSACRASKLVCVTSGRTEGVKRRRIHVSNDYERKIDLIESKLAGLDRVLQKPVVHSDSSPKPQRAASSHLASNLSPGGAASPGNVYPGEGTLEAETNVYEGSTSLNAQAVQARALVERALGQGSFASTAQEVSSAVSSLKDMANATSRHATSPNTVLSSPFKAHRVDYRKLPLPPTYAVLDILRRSKDTQTILFDMPLNWATRSRVVELAQQVFFSVDDYTLATALIVHGSLYQLFVEFERTATDSAEKTEHLQHAELCLSNYEACICSLDLLLPATPENIEALLMGAQHGVERSSLNVSWKLKNLALSLVQTLGWHRASSLANDDPATRTRKQKMFWYLYILDKGLSLRLGRASSFQDYDIDLPYPEPQGNLVEKDAIGILTYSIRMFRIQGLIYEQLYSPAALSQPTTTTLQRAQQLLSELDLLHETVQLRRGEMESLRKPYVLDVRGALDVCLLSNTVTHYSNITMCYRAIPENEEASGLNRNCLEAARTALHYHQIAVGLKASERSYWNMYVMWTILFTPFIPYLVVFSHVIATSNVDDLYRLRDFVESMADCDLCDAARNLYHFCSMFYRIAHLYIDVKRKQQDESPIVHDNSPPQLDPAMGPCDLSTLNPYLNSLGFTGDPMADFNAGITGDVGDWFTGNQFLTSLMDVEAYTSGYKLMNGQDGQP